MNHTEVDTYTVSFKCPKCKRRLTVEKKKDRRSVHARKIQAYAEHAKHCPALEKE